MAELTSSIQSKQTLVDHIDDYEYIYMIFSFLLRAIRALQMQRLCRALGTESATKFLLKHIYSIEADGWLNEWMNEQVLWLVDWCVKSLHIIYWKKCYVRHEKIIHFDHKQNGSHAAICSQLWLPMNFSYVYQISASQKNTLHYNHTKLVRIITAKCTFNWEGWKDEKSICILRNPYWTFQSIVYSSVFLWWEQSSWEQTSWEQSSQSGPCSP